ncbi:hypothetical protein [Microbulbifer marinus]|uniref:Uncharacterized protein n=1 Tax=Microbulbifer marinus TaxID=658218 RepID=A0A1H3VV53_9GAMM|nr:hypothetical protein [Microbulbifer marinus]SDZ78713.1 hypothetical protein SAMN05216562_0303 [Microbulbifer marinus]
MKYIVFCAHEIPKVYEGLTGGFVDRLKGLSSAILLSRLFGVKLVVLWREPFPINNYFNFSDEIEFFEGHVDNLVECPKINFLHKNFQAQISNRNPLEFYQSLKDILQSSPVVFFSNRECGELFRYFSKCCGEEALKLLPQNGWDIFGQGYISVSDRIRPEKINFETKKDTVSLHFRVGGENLRWTDPALYNEERLPNDLGRLCSSLAKARGKIRFKVFSDNTQVRERAVNILRSNSFEVHESNCEPVHLERSQGFHAAELAATLREWVDIGDASFVIRTAGAFAAYAAKCRGIDVFNIDDISAIEGRVTQM